MSESDLSLTADRRGAPDIRDIWTARKRIAPLVKATALYETALISREQASSVFLKLETAHETGAFKIRGAANKILSLSEPEQKRGVITFSTGNHGIAVAYCAGKLGIPAAVCLSGRVPEAKIETLRRLGASVIVVGNNQDDAEAHCYRLAEEEGRTVIKPFDDPLVIAGQGTIGLELLEECADLDTVLIPVSGGGLFAGIALALKTTLPEVKLIGVSMARSAVMYQSLKEGRPVVLEEEPTLADSLLGGIGTDNRYTFELVKKYIDEFVLVTEEEIARAMGYLFKNHRLVAEGAGAAALAALLGQVSLKPGGKAAVLVTGNNVDMESFLKATAGYIQERNRS